MRTQRCAQPRAPPTSSPSARTLAHLVERVLLLAPLALLVPLALLWRRQHIRASTAARAARRRRQLLGARHRRACVALLTAAAASDATRLHLQQPLVLAAGLPRSFVDSGAWRQYQRLRHGWTMSRRVLGDRIKVIEQKEVTAPRDAILEEWLRPRTLC